MVLFVFDEVFGNHAAIVEGHADKIGVIVSPRARECFWRRVNTRTGTLPCLVSELIELVEIHTVFYLIIKHWRVKASIR